MEPREASELGSSTKLAAAFAAAHAQRRPVRLGPSTQLLLLSKTVLFRGCITSGEQRVYDFRHKVQEVRLVPSQRLVFLFDTRRLRPSGLAGELVVALEEETDVTASDLQRQFARTPYAVSFTTGRDELTLVVLHVLWGKNEAERVPELREIATWLADWPRRGRGART
jgi:hypothetical protein